MPGPSSVPCPATPLGVWSRRCTQGGYWTRGGRISNRSLRTALGLCVCCRDEIEELLVPKHPPALSCPYWLPRPPPPPSQGEAPETRPAVRGRQRCCGKTVLLGERGPSAEDPQESPQRISVGGLAHWEDRGQGHPAFRTKAWISRDTAMLLESQVVLEEQGGSGNGEEGATQKLRVNVGTMGIKDSLRSAPGSHHVRPGLCPLHLQGQFSHMTSFHIAHKVGRAGISVTHDDGDTDQSAWGTRGTEILVEQIAKRGRDYLR